MCDIKILDGGLATELANLGYKVDEHPLWSAHLLSNNCEAILNVHKSYLRSGADIITTASYQASFEGFHRYLGATVEEAEQLISKSVTIAKQACNEFICEASNTYSPFGKKPYPLVAGSVGPYAVLKADGSEYTGNYIDNISCEELIAWHRPRVKSLVNAECDLLAFETIPGEKEGVALVKLLREFPNSKAWLSFCCQDAHLTAHKESLATAIKNSVQMCSSDQLVAVGVNCCPPVYVKSLLSDILHLPTGVAKLAYPNSGEEWESKKGWTKTNNSFPIANYVEEWISVGGKWLGGCCRTTPNDIAAISKKIHCSI